MKKVLFGLAATGILMSACLVKAWAGYKASFAVLVNPTNRWVTGALSSTRNTPDSASYIGCYAYYTGSPFAVCYARDASLVSASCSSTDPGFIAGVSAIKGDSNVYFTWDANGTCTVLRVTQDSMLEPKLM